MIPGMIDAHVHLVHVLDFAHVTGDEILPLFTAAGVTSVRSAGDEVVAATAVAHYARSHPETCPRVFTCSPLIDGDPVYHKDIGIPVTDPEQVPKLLDDMRHWEVRTVKIYARSKRNVGQRVITEAHQRGMIVTAHLGAYSAQDAVADGVDCLEHIWSVFNYVIPAAVAQKPGHRGTVDFNNPLVKELVPELVRRKVRVDPTLSVFRNMILLNDLPEVANHPDNQTVPERLRQFWPRYTPPPKAPLEERRAEFRKYQELTGILHKAGVTILAGTDTPEPNVAPGLSLHQELEFLVQAGLSPAAALQAATINNAHILREGKTLGSIEAGKWADLVILEANPLDDIRNTRRIQSVVKGGSLVTPAELLRLVPRK
ncbi:MAG: amidohydrolase family protein [Planctomycetales bacterium]